MGDKSARLTTADKENFYKLVGEEFVFEDLKTCWDEERIIKVYETGEYKNYTLHYLETIYKVINRKLDAYVRSHNVYAQHVLGVWGEDGKYYRWVIPCEDTVRDDLFEGKHVQYIEFVTYFLEVLCEELMELDDSEDCEAYRFALWGKIRATYKDMRKGKVEEYLIDTPQGVTEMVKQLIEEDKNLARIASSTSYLDFIINR